MLCCNLRDVFDSIKVELSTIYPEEEVVSLRAIILEKVLKVGAFKVFSEPTYQIEYEPYMQIEEVIKRLLQNEPIQYILGETEFYGLPFHVDSRVLIPRPETEELVSLILSNFGSKRDLCVVDVGTGSGCIAISLAKNLSKPNVVALDVSLDALNVAKQNATLNRVDIDFLQLDILSDIQFPCSTFDIVVSNPPYVRESERELMQPNVLNNEPELALFVPDSNPLIFYEAIAKMALHSLKPDGWLFFEINEALGCATRLMLQNYGFAKVQVHADIFGKERFVSAMRSF